MERRDLLKSGLLAAFTAQCTTPQQDRGGADPIDLLSNRVKDVPAVPSNEFEQRFEKLRSLLKEHETEGFFLESGPAMEYFTGIRWWRSERPFGVVVPADGTPVLICPGFEEERAREQFAFEMEVRVWQEHEDPFRLLAQTLRDRGFSHGKIAMEPSVRYFLVGRLVAALPAVEIVDGAPIVEACRMVKSPLEVEYMDLANQITKSAYAAALAGLTAGMSESDLAERVSRAHAKQGVSGGAMVLFGPSSAMPHGSKEERKLREGDVVLIDGGCSLNGYRSDVTRTVFFGAPDEEQRKVWELVFEVQSAGIEGVRPGVTCASLDSRCRKMVADAGFGADYEHFTHRLGHGIGLEVHEAPYLVRGNGRILEPGMTFSVEPGIYQLGKWGVRHEDIVLVTESGVRILGERASFDSAIIG